MANVGQQAQDLEVAEVLQDESLRNNNEIEAQLPGPSTPQHTTVEIESQSTNVRSGIWKHFKVVTEKGVKLAKCNHCRNG